MHSKVRRLVAVIVVGLFLSLEGSSEDMLARMARQHEPYTLTVELEFVKKNRNPMMRAFSAVATFNPNAHASGFLVGEGLVMTSYHVVSGKLSARKKHILGFKPDDELDITVYVNGCQAKVVKVNPKADLALLKICTSKPVQRPRFRITPDKDEPVMMIARSGEQKLIRRGSCSGAYDFGGFQFLSVKIDGQDGFSGSPVYDHKGEIVGVFTLYDYERGVALLCPSEKVQEFLAEYDASQQSQ